MKIDDHEIFLGNRTAASVPTPAAGFIYLFVENSKFKQKDDTGAITDLTALGTSGAPTGTKTSALAAAAAVAAANEFAINEAGVSKKVTAAQIKTFVGGAPMTVDQTITDGSANAVAGNAVFDALALKAPLARPIVAKTVNYQILASESGTIFTNGSATTAPAFYLPGVADCIAGVTNFTFIRTSAGADLVFAVTGNDVINDSNGGYTSKVAYDALSLTFFGTLNGSQTWVITAFYGGWLAF